MTEDKIREALSAIADRAPHPMRVTTGLANRRQEHRQRRALLAAGAATAVAATVGGVTALTRLRSADPVTGIVPPGGETPTPGPSASPPPGTLPTPSPEPAPQGGNTWVPMKYRPTWLPEGMTEYRRMVTISGVLPFGLDQDRLWGSIDGAGGHDMSLSVEWRKPKAAKGTTPVIIRGRPGWLDLQLDERDPDSSSAGIVWQEDTDVWLSVGFQPQQDAPTDIAVLGKELTDTVTRIAESVVPDGITGCEVFVEFGWLPESLRGAPQSLGINPANDGGWSVGLSVDTDEMGVSVEIGPMAALDVPGDPVTVRGHRGKKVLFTYPMGGKNDHGVVFVDLGSVRLRVDSMSKIRVSQDDLVRIADDLRIGPNPYLGWAAGR